MTYTERFISALLRSSRSAQEEYRMRAVSQGIFRQNINEIAWVEQFRDKHGEYPSIFAYEQHFKRPLKKVRDSIGAALQPILDEASFQELKRVIDNTNRALQNKLAMADVMRQFKEGAARIEDSAENAVTEYDFNDSALANRRYMDRYEKRLSGELYRYDTPWPSMNRILRYFGNSAHIILASRTSIGKTWLAVYWCAYLLKKSINCLFVSKEMTTEEVADRMECTLFELPYTNFREGALNPKELAQWRMKMQSRQKYKVRITGEETITGTGLNYIGQLVEDVKPEVTFIDGAYLIEPEGCSASTNMVQKYTAISRFNKRLAKATKSIVVSVIQTNRDAEDEKGNTKGGLTELYGADAWGQDADAVFIIEGARGNQFRKVALKKGRESALTDVIIGFKLYPYPSFGELPVQENAGQIVFKPLSKVS